MPWSDKQLRAHKRASAGLSVATSTVGIGALGVAAARGGAGRGLKLAQRAGKLKKVTPANLEHFKAKSSGVQNGMLIAGAGLGGVGGFNSAAIQNTEAKRRVSKMSGGMDFGLGQVHQGEISKASPTKRQEASERGGEAGFWGGAAGGGAGVLGHRAVKHGRSGYDFSRELGGGRLTSVRSGAASGGAALRGTRKALKLSPKLRGRTFIGAAAGGVLGSAVGAGVNGMRYDHKQKVKKGLSTGVLRPVKQAATLGRDAKTGVKVIGQDYKTHGYGQAKRTAGVVGQATKGNIKANKQGAALIAGSATAATAGGAGVAYGVKKAAPPIKLASTFSHPAGKITRRAARNIGKPGHISTATSEYAVRRRPTTALKVVGGTGAGGAVAGAGYGLSQRRKEPVAKDYNPERKRARRLDNYTTGAATAAGGLGVGAVVHGRGTVQRARMVRDMADGVHHKSTFRGADYPLNRGAVRVASRNVARRGGVTAAIGLGAVGAAVGADRIRSYKRGNGRTYRPLHAQL